MVEGGGGSVEGEGWGGGRGGAPCDKVHGLAVADLRIIYAVAGEGSK
jgi:hypothetical protein